ncbi:hypothetical protein PoB_005949100 [Plakobranchus ocellatus]|uniref:Uncharacterized protein n=1 Tax=Plakobranchus ocellatus TaxID=259542 RepID=A0AAV4CMA9_9GAST|nr:hypothetical protein PoB_005949100 [Plakobranchus ocellatus]
MESPFKGRFRWYGATPYSEFAVWLSVRLFHFHEYGIDIKRPSPVVGSNDEALIISNDEALTVSKDEALIISNSEESAENAPIWKNQCPRTTPASGTPATGAQQQDQQHPDQQ